MSLLSNFLGTENYDFMESPMFRELIENLKQEAAEEKNKFVYTIDTVSDFTYQNNTLISGNGQYNKIYRKNTDKFTVYKCGEDKKVDMKKGAYKDYPKINSDRKENREVAA